MVAGDEDVGGGAVEEGVEAGVVVVVVPCLTMWSPLNPPPRSGSCFPNPTTVGFCIPSSAVQNVSVVVAIDSNF